MFKAAIRVNKITTIAQLRGASLHAQRYDITGKARVRDGAEPGFGLAWSKDENDRDYLAAFRAHKAELNAGERKGAPIALQALCVVSPEWVEKAGDLHDPDNPHNRRLFDEAKAWAESWAGAGSVFGSRLDLDEKGGAVVDLMIAPVRTSRGKPVISTNKAMGEVKALTGERNEYAALQTSWAHWCRDTLDTEIMRGTRKEITRRQHLSPETYGLVMDKARESLAEPSQMLLEQLKYADLTEDASQTLSDLLTLKVEVKRHETLGREYQAPEGAVAIGEVGLNDKGGYWAVLDGLCSGAKRVLDAAERLGLGFKETDNDEYENGRGFFPRLLDRMHLFAVIAKCGVFFSKAEQHVKRELKGENVELEDCWPEFAHAQAERHEINLGLVASQPEHSIADKRGVGVELDDCIEKKRSVGIERDTGYSI
tara:strand:+ start:4103 stop:5380 length:1278 start_codon:yes stop_codon:yes gene_type:complete